MRKVLRRSLGLLAVTLVPALGEAAQVCTPTPPMMEARAYHTATQLSPTTVLVAGGVAWWQTGTASTEIYDLQADAWHQTPRPLNHPRWGHTATPLTSGPDAKVLVVGGFSTDYWGNPMALASVELYDPDPAHTTWADTASLNHARGGHTATLLESGPNAGKVLVVGGEDPHPTDALTSAELYDPVNGTWSLAGDLNEGRYAHTATLLVSGADAGKVLVVGGYNFVVGGVSSAELYDPVTGWSQTAPLSVPRSAHTATLLLPSGDVLVAGGTGPAPAEVYVNGSWSPRLDPVTGVWSPPAGVLGLLGGHTATLLDTGHREVLVAGGSPSGCCSPVASMQLYYNGIWTAMDPETLTTPRVNHTATLMKAGAILFTGGFTGEGRNTIATATAEVCRPQP